MREGIDVLFLQPVDRNKSSACTLNYVKSIYLYLLVDSEVSDTEAGCILRLFRITMIAVGFNVQKI